MKVAFLDRDGTIVADYPDKMRPSVSEPEFLPGAIDALAAFQGKDYRLIMVTNQYLIGEGLITQAQYDTLPPAGVDAANSRRAAGLCAFLRHEVASWTAEHDGEGMIQPWGRATCSRTAGASLATMGSQARRRRGEGQPPAGSAARTDG
jgi:hypothetical protein